MLQIRNLKASIGEFEILKGINLTIKPGEVHAIMGPNGSGKSTLSHILAGRSTYDITEGQVLFEGEDLLTLDPEERAWKGIFLSFQHPVAIPGIKNSTFLRTSFNSIRKARGQEPLDAVEFLKLLKEKTALVELPKELLSRSLNDGFSGGEKKRNEILQMTLLEPKLSILDETDSGLDIDALSIIAKGINTLRSPQRSMVVITHYQRLLNYVVPDYVHVLAHGQIIRSGGKDLALELEEKGYSWIEPANSKRFALPVGN